LILCPTLKIRYEKFSGVATAERGGAPVVNARPLSLSSYVRLRDDFSSIVVHSYSLTEKIMY